MLNLNDYSVEVLEEMFGALINSLSTASGSGQNVDELLRLTGEVYVEIKARKEDRLRTRQVELREKQVGLEIESNSFSWTVLPFEEIEELKLIDHLLDL